MKPDPNILIVPLPEDIRKNLEKKPDSNERDYPEPDLEFWIGLDDRFIYTG